MRVPPEVISALLTFLAFGGTVLGTVLVRRGKREDTRIAMIDQNFDQMRDLAADRLAEINRLNAELRLSREDSERVRESWEQRWHRQMVRCRTVTEPLISAITALEKVAGPDMKRDVDAVRRIVAEHNQDDHPDPKPNT